MEKGFVTSEIKNNIAEITFGTPKSNSLPGEILELLAKIILESGKDENVKAILLKYVFPSSYNLEVLANTSCTFLPNCELNSPAVIIMII